MPAPPIESRIERLPNWAQAYIGKLSRQIMQLSADQGIPVPSEPDPTPVYSLVDNDGIQHMNYRPIGEDNSFVIDAGKGKITVTIVENGVQLVAGYHRFAIAPNGRGSVDVLLVGHGANKSD